jgi:hypothetical protein
MNNSIYDEHHGKMFMMIWKMTTTERDRTNPYIYIGEEKKKIQKAWERERKVIEENT